MTRREQGEREEGERDEREGETGHVPTRCTYDRIFPAVYRGMSTSDTT